MIDNYLSEVKMNRKLSLHSARQAMRIQRSADDSWLRGFYAGIRCTSELQSRWWRALQKDIEALLEVNRIEGFDAFYKDLIGKLYTK